LGYTPESITEAFEDDPIGTLQLLQQEEWTARQRQSTQDNRSPAEIAREEARKATEPVLQHIVRQKADAANAMFDKEFDSEFNSHPMFKGRNDVPSEIRQVVYDMVSESLKYNTPALKALYDGGKTAEVKRTFDGVMERFQKVVNQYIDWTTGSGGESRGASRGRSSSGSDGEDKGFEQPSLDDIISGNAKARKAMPSMR
jgi:hypothetical protein